jgi:hypothetical protein
MRRRRSPLPLVLVAALGGCAGTRADRAQLAALLQDAPDDVPARLWVDGERLVGAAAPLGPGMLPPDVRMVFDAIAPGGRTLFVGREWGARGDGYRLDKEYPDLAGAPRRSVLAAPDGTVLERWHTVPLPDVPQHVLAAALRVGPFVEQARIVSGREREELWVLVVRDRTRRTFVVRVALDGVLLGRARELPARLGVTAPG